MSSLSPHCVQAPAVVSDTSVLAPTLNLWLFKSPDSYNVLLHNTNNPNNIYSPGSVSLYINRPINNTSEILGNCKYYSLTLHSGMHFYPRMLAIICNEQDFMFNETCQIRMIKVSLYCNHINCIVH